MISCQEKLFDSRSNACWRSRVKRRATFRRAAGIVTRYHGRASSACAMRLRTNTAKSTMSGSTVSQPRAFPSRSPRWRRYSKTNEQIHLHLGTMEIKPIRTKTDYRAALKEIETLMSARADTPEGARLNILSKLVEAYEKKHLTFPVELYSEGRIGEFDEAEADMEKILPRRKKTRADCGRAKR